MTSTKPIVLDTLYYSLGFPRQNDENIISRENYISQIDDHFNSGADLVFLQGEEDAGKTTLAAEYVKSKRDRSISVFFNPLNVLDYSLDFYYSNVVYQIKSILGYEVDFEKDRFVSNTEYEQYIIQIRKLWKKKSTPIYLIIDGLEDKIENDPEMIQQIFSVIPFGYDIFKILITGNHAKFLLIYEKLKRINTEHIILSGFSVPEIKSYLRLNDDNVGSFKELYAITKGLPGRLKTLNRLLLNSEYTLQKISNSNSYTHWIELDVKSVDLNNSTTQAVMALMAFSQNSYTKDEICQIIGLSWEHFDTLLSRIKFIEIQNSYVAFSSVAHKRFIANQLRATEKKVKSLLIDYYSKTDTINSLIELPKLYASNKDWPKIINIIDDEYSKKILDNTESIKQVSENLDLGLQAAKLTNRYSELWRYSIEGSIIKELDNAMFFESEIRAKLSLKDFTGAVALACGAMLKIERLRLLALIARTEKETNKKVDDDLVKLITDLYKTTDLISVGDKIYDIVSDLIYALPSLAIEMIEKLSGDSSERSINDWIVAKLSIAAIDSTIKENEDPESSKKLEAVQTLKNASVKKIYKAISFLVGNYSANKVLEEVEKLTDSKEKLRLLRLWLRNNRTNFANVNIVIGKGLQELVYQTSKTYVTYDVLKELSQPLAKVMDETKKKSLVKEFKNVEQGVSQLGLNKDKFTYDINIFHAEFTYDLKSSIKSLNKILNEVDNVSDKLIKVEAYAEIYIKLSQLNHFELNNKLNFAYSRILALTKELFDDTANHSKISRLIIETLARRNPNLCIKVIYNINTESRREEALLLVIEKYLENSIKDIRIESFNRLAETLTSSVNVENAYIQLLERFSFAKVLGTETVKNLASNFQRIEKFKNIEKKVYALVLLLKIIHKDTYWQRKLQKVLEEKIYSYWKRIDSDWERINIGFTICADVSRINQQLAKNIYKESQELKESSWLDSDLIAYTYINSIKLVIRAFRGLLITGKNKDSDQKVIEDLIARIPSGSDRLILWSEIGLNSYLDGIDSFSKKVLDLHVMPLLTEFIDNNIELFEFTESLILLHIFQPDLSISYTRKLPSDYQERVYARMCDFYITKRNPFDIYEQKVTKYRTSYLDLTKVLSIMDFLNSDQQIYLVVTMLSEAVVGVKNTLTKIQITSIYEALANQISRKLPDPKNIKHNGYQLISNLKISKLKRDLDRNYVEGLLHEIAKIPNRSDRVFVRAIFIDEIQFDKISGGTSVRQNLFTSIIEDLNSLSSHYEFVQRVIDISDYMYGVDRGSWKQIVNKAFSLCENLGDGSDIYNSRKNIIDSFYRLDPSYAKELIKMIENSKNNEQINDLLRNHYDSLEIANKIKNNKELTEKEKDKYKNIVQAVMSTLRSLNSEKVSPKKISEAIQYLPIGNKLPLHQVIPIHIYYLNNCIQTYREKHQEGLVANIHRENFVKAIKCTNIIEILSHKRKNIGNPIRRFFIDEEFNSNKSIRPGSRDEAMAYLSKWIQEEVKDELIIADPYFKKEDLDILKLIKQIQPNIAIQILGSKFGIQSNTEDILKEYWAKISEENPPFTMITYCWIPDDNNSSPFHDRWLISKNGGLRLGTSINSLGIKKESEISTMQPSEALAIKENNILEYINRTKREHLGHRLKYRSFTL